MMISKAAFPTARLLICLAGLVLLLNDCVSAQKAANSHQEEQQLSAQDIEASLDPEPAIDGSTNEEAFYGQWENKAENAADVKEPMQFIRKFSWERRVGDQDFVDDAELLKEQLRAERRKRPAENEYDEALAARFVAEEDVDRLTPAEGGDRLAYTYEPMPQTQAKPKIDFTSTSFRPTFGTTKGTSFAPRMSTSAPTIPTKFPAQKQSTRWPKLSAVPQMQLPSKSSEGTVALNEFDLKSDNDLAKMMRRTTLRTREYPQGERWTTPSTTTPLPLLGFGTSPAPSLLTLPGLLFPQPVPAPAPSQPQQNFHQNRRGLRAEQFEQLGCGWDFMTNSCKDVFRFGWCQNCVDFGNPFLHDCRCTAVTGLYVQTATFLGSSAASARANAAATAVANNHSAPVAGAGPFYFGKIFNIIFEFFPVFAALPPLLPTLEQLAQPLEMGSQSGAGSSSSPSFLAQTVTPATQVVKALADAFHLPSTVMPIGGHQPFAALFGGAAPTAVQQSQHHHGQQELQYEHQQQNVAVAPLLAPPARAFGAAHFVPPSNVGPLPIVPQFVGRAGRKRK